MKRTVRFPPGMLPPEDEPRKQPLAAAFAATYGAAILIFAPMPAALALSCVAVGAVAGGLMLLEEEVLSLAAGGIALVVPLWLTVALAGRASDVTWQPYVLASSAMILTFFAPEALAYGRSLWSRFRATSPPASDA